MTPLNFGVAGTASVSTTRRPAVPNAASPERFPPQPRSLADLLFFNFSRSFALVLFPGVGRETPTPTSGVCFEVGNNVWFLSPGTFLIPRANWLEVTGERINAVGPPAG